MGAKRLTDLAQVSTGTEYPFIRGDYVGVARNSPETRKAKLDGPLFAPDHDQASDRNKLLGVNDQGELGLFYGAGAGGWAETNNTQTTLPVSPGNHYPWRLFILHATIPHSAAPGGNLQYILPLVPAPTAQTSESRLVSNDGVDIGFGLESGGLSVGIGRHYKSNTTLFDFDNATWIIYYIQ